MIWVSKPALFFFGGLGQVISAVDPVGTAQSHLAPVPLSKPRKKQNLLEKSTVIGFLQMTKLLSSDKHSQDIDS